MDNLFFNDALSQCQNNGARLVQPKTNSDNDLYVSLVGFPNTNLWIAVNDANIEGIFQGRGGYYSYRGKIESKFHTLVFKASGQMSTTTRP